MIFAGRSDLLQTMNPPSGLFDTNDLALRPNLGQASSRRNQSSVQMNRCARKHYCFIVGGCHLTQLYTQEVYQFGHVLNVAEVVDHFQTSFDLLLAQSSSRYQ